MMGLGGGGDGHFNVLEEEKWGQFQNNSNHHGQNFRKIKIYEVL